MRNEFIIPGRQLIFTGCMLGIGIIIQSVTSRCFDGIEGIVDHCKDTLGYDYTLRDMIVMAGQPAGELCWMVGLWPLFRNRITLFLAITEFVMALCIISLIMILFFNPYLPSWPKDTGIIISLCYVLVSTKRYIK